MTFGRPRSSVDSGGFKFGNGRGGADAASTPAPNGGGKALSLAGLLGKRGQIHPINAHTSSQFETDVTLHANKPRRSFDGILRPEMTPISIIPYPASDVPMDGLAAPRKQPSAGLSFSRSTSRMAGGMNGSGDGHPRREPENVREQHDNNNDLSTDDIPAGYIRTHSRAETGALCVPMKGNTHTPSPSSMIAAPLPGYAHFDPGNIEIIETTNSHVNDVQEQTTRVSERDNGNTGSKVVDAGTALGKRQAPLLAHSLRRERLDPESQDQDQQGSGQHPPKRTRKDADEGYIALSSPQMPATPMPIAPPSQQIDPYTTLDSLFSDLGDIVNVEEFEADCRRWRECTREEWMKGTEELSDIFKQLLDTVKDHLTYVFSPQLIH
ncbi:hypothetical protein V8B97DRAFT_1948394 [Scleroderma yunnanense]